MNCQDIEEILDNRDIGRLDESVRGDIAAHTSGCAGCARDWDLHARFAALPLVGQSAGFAAGCRAAVAMGSARSGSRHARRYVVVGLIAAVSAAAAMLVVQQWRAVTPARSEDPAVVLPSQEVDSAPPAAQLRAADTPAEPDPQSRPLPAPVIAAFQVQVMPLQNDARDAAGQAAVESFYVAMLEQLRRVEGLQLVMADPADSRVGEDAPYQISIRGSGPDADNKFTGRVRAMRREPGGVVQPVAGQFDRDCVDPRTARCFDADALAAALIDLLRARMFPADEARQQSLLTRLQDATQGSRQRLKALQELASPRIVRIEEDRFAIKSDALRDPAVVRAAIDLAETTAEPAVRAEVWRRLRGARDAGLLRPLIASAQLDPDRDVRIEAVRALGAGFSGQAEARSALEAVTRQEPLPLVRALAQSGLKGGDTWNSYVAESLKDATRPDEERIEALLYETSWSSSQAQDVVKLIIDTGAVPALAEMLSRLASSGANRDTIARLVNYVGPVDHSAITELLLTRFEAGNATGRDLYIGQLARRTKDPRVRAALQRVADQDPDPVLRQMAERALREATAERAAEGAVGMYNGAGAG